MAKTAIQEHMYIGSLKIGRGIPNVSLQHKIQAVFARPLSATFRKEHGTTEQISSLRVEQGTTTDGTFGHASARPVIPRLHTKH